MGIPLLAGESLPQPATDAPPVLVINSVLADTWFPGENPVGRRLKLTAFDQNAPYFTIAGVVGATRHTALDADLRPQVYVHQRLEPNQQMVVVLRAASEPAAYASIARAAVRELDPNQPVGRVRTMVDVVAASVASRRFAMLLVAIFAGLALLLSLVGLYAVVSHSVAERTQEMGVRLALGASPGRLLALVVGEGIRLVALGVAVGLAAAFAGTRFIENLLFGISAYDPVTFAVVPTLLIGAAVLGCLIPARRAMRVDPMTALRTE
jgi:hypothetical protein